MPATVQHLDVRASTYYKRQAALGDAARGRLTQSGGGRMTEPTEGLVAKSRAQVLNLIDFLSAYDAQRNPPVRRLEDHGMFRPAGQVDAALRLVFGLMR